MRFCARCGFPLEGAMVLLAHNGMLPRYEAADGETKISARRKGVKQGALLFLIGVVLVPLLAIFSNFAPPRIEMAFEEQRFFDVRRWMIAPEALSKGARGINIFLEGANRIDRGTWKNYRYETRAIQDRAWNNSSCQRPSECMYFMPIPRDELNRNALLRQNPGF